MTVQKTLCEIVELLKTDNNDELFGLCVGEFLDHVKTVDKKAIYDLIIDEPVRYENIEDWKYSYFSVIAHTLVNQYDIDVDEDKQWYNHRKYILKEPYFPENFKGKIRLILLVESPYEFRIKNMFVAENALNRV
jgi:hypothetical protein